MLSELAFIVQTLRHTQRQAVTLLRREAKLISRVPRDLLL